MTTMTTSLVYLLHVPLSLSLSKSILEPPQPLPLLLLLSGHPCWAPFPLHVSCWSHSCHPWVSLRSLWAHITPSLMDTGQICMQKRWWEMKSMMLGTSSQLMNSRLTWDSVSSWGCRSIGFSFGQLLELRPCPPLLPHCWQDFQGLFLRNFSLSSLCS